MNVTVMPSTDGRWQVIDAETKEIISSHPSNSAAWRAADRLSREPNTPRENVADWLHRKSL